MNKYFEEAKKLLKRDVYILGYESLRYSIFSDENVEAYQIRVDFVKEEYIISVISADRVISEKYVFADILDALDKFRVKLEKTVSYNRHKVLEDEEPDYECVLWGEEWLADYKKRSRWLGIRV